MSKVGGSSGILYGGAYIAASKALAWQGGNGMGGYMSFPGSYGKRYDGAWQGKAQVTKQ